MMGDESSTMVRRQLVLLVFPYPRMATGARPAAIAPPEKRQKIEEKEEVVAKKLVFSKLRCSALVMKMADDVSLPRRDRIDEFDDVPFTSADELLGAVIPRVITDEVRPFLIKFCNMAMDKFNAETQEEDAKYTFADIVHFNTALCNGRCFFITFLGRRNNSASAAAAAANADDDDDDDHPNNMATFQAKVWQKRSGCGDDEVIFCRLKPAAT
ncbi:hypothetical protein RIF29_11875 [Crotalaria pallida]|uniref:Uncharacterized protein n=1 Tax=Crotalaria pallida TaxID=3830 RepID=A0AAN9IMK3_CROPI